MTSSCCELNNCKHIWLQRTWRSSEQCLLKLQPNQVKNYTYNRRKTKSLFMPCMYSEGPTVSHHHWALQPIGQVILWKDIPFLAAKLTSSLQLTRLVFIKLAQQHISYHLQLTHNILMVHDNLIKSIPSIIWLLHETNKWHNAALQDIDKL